MVGRMKGGLPIIVSGILLHGNPPESTAADPSHTHVQIFEST